MSDLSDARISAEQLAERIVDLGLLEPREIEAVWSDLGTRHISAEELESTLLRRGLLTNLQVDKLVKLIAKNERWNFFYGKYKVLYLVGEGTFARVYRAVHRDSGQVFALKVLRQRKSAEPDTVENFMMEAKMVMQLRHPNIVPIYEVDTERGRPYMVMEFVEGQNLRDFVRMRKKLSVEDSLRLIGDIESGLEYAQTKGMTHRDLKLSNVLITSLGRAKIVDFGLAALAAAIEEGLIQGSSARSIDYAGLERISGAKRDDTRSDIFFSGCILYHLLSGQPPLSESKERSQRLSVSRFREVAPLTKWEPDLPRPLVSLVGRAMELDPDKRFQSHSEFLAEIKLVNAQLQRGVTASGEGDAPEAAAEPAPLPPEVEGLNKTVMVVESNSEWQNIFRDQLKRRGYRVLVISDPQRALQRFAETLENVADIVVFSTMELQEAAVEAFNQFGADEKTRQLPAILYVAEGHRGLAAAASFAPHRILLAAPLTIRVLRAALLKLLKQP